MGTIERIEALNQVLSNPSISAVVGFLMVVIAAGFLCLYAIGMKNSNSVKQAKKSAKERITHIAMVKDCEIEKIKQERNRIVWEKFAALTENKILREQLNSTRKLLEWEQYKNAQLLRGVKLSDEERETFISERNSGNSEHIS